MATIDNIERYKLLTAWMKERNISFPIVGEKFKEKFDVSVTSGAIRKAMQKETCKTSHHSNLLALGFPADLLPTPLDKPSGPKRKEPHFPGLLPIPMDKPRGPKHKEPPISDQMNNPATEVESKPRDCLRPHEVEALYGISRNTLKHWRNMGTGPRYMQRGSGKGCPVFYTHDAIKEYMDKNIRNVAVEDGITSKHG